MALLYRFVFVLLLCCFALPIFAQYDEQKTFNYLETTFNAHDKYLLDVLITELTHYLKVFPNSPNAPRAQQMLAQVYSEKRKKDETIASYLKMVCLYPDIANIAGNTDELRQLVSNERSYQDKKDWLLSIIDQNIPKRPISDSYYQYLGILVELDQSGLRDWALEECRNFYLQFPDDPRNEQVVRWMADTYLAKRDYREAVSMHSKFESLFPGNPLTPTILHQKAAVHYDNLRDHEKALEILNRLVADHSGDVVIPDALYMRGEIFSSKLKNYQDAIADYRRLVDNYPDHPNVIETLERMADIHKKDLKDYPAAITVLNEIVEKTDDETKGVGVLEEIAALYEKQLNDYEATIQTYTRIAELYPSYDKAPDRLIDAGQICERQLNDYQKAISYYQMVLDKFPAHQKADDARKKMENAQKKLGQN